MGQEAAIHKPDAFMRMLPHSLRSSLHQKGEPHGSPLVRKDYGFFVVRYLVIM